MHSPKPAWIILARKTFDAKQMAEKLSSNLMRNMEPVNPDDVKSFDSHDTHRFFYWKSGENPDRLLAALALEMVFPGAPCTITASEIARRAAMIRILKMLDWGKGAHRCFSTCERSFDGN